MSQKNQAVEEDTDVERTMGAREGVRDQLESDIEAFLRLGGDIQVVDNNISTDPPTRPISKYGGRPI